MMKLFKKKKTKPKYEPELRVGAYCIERKQVRYAEDNPDQITDFNDKYVFVVDLTWGHQWKIPIAKFKKDWITL